MISPTDEDRQAKGPQAKQLMDLLQSRLCGLAW